MPSSLNGNTCATGNGCESTFAVHSFSEDISERKFIFQVVKMLDSLLVYINDQGNFTFSDISVAIKNRYGNTPVGSHLIGSFTEDTSKNLACKLSKKLNKVVFLSYDIDNDQLLAPLIEKRLFEEIKNSPDKF